MIWGVIVLLAVLAILIILFLNRFYVKASRELALVRTGLGGQRVVLDGGVINLPIVHRTAEVNIMTQRLEVERVGERSIITQDRLRIDATAEFYVRVDPTPDGVATAAQALGGKAIRAADLADLLEGKLADALLSVAATYTMDSLQDNRGQYVAAVSDALTERLAANGLVLESVSLTRLDQTPFGALDQNNAFNAVGMRRLAEVIATNRKERAAIENAAEVAVRQSALDATKRRLVIEQEEEEAQLTQRQTVETTRARTAAETAEAQAEAEERREFARIKRDAEVRSKQISTDREIRELELQSDLTVKTTQADTQIALAGKRAAEAAAEAQTQASLAQEAAAREGVETARETAVAERSKVLAVIKAQEAAAVDDTRVESEAGTIRAMAAAEADATERKAQAAKQDRLARAEGDLAINQAQNALSDAIVRMQIDLAKIGVMPELVREMVKPAEKIDSIRINQMAGFGTGPGAVNGFGSGAFTGSGGASGHPVVNQVIDGILSMALQLPAVKKMGEEIGVNIGTGVMDALERRDGETAGQSQTQTEG